MGDKALQEETLLTDSLPYIDLDFSEDAARRVENLIKQEMRTFRPKDYLSDKPVIENSPYVTPVLETEKKRLAVEEPLEKIDTSRLRAPLPSNPSDLSAWEKSVGNVCSQVQHEENKSVNAELLNRFGPNAWQEYIKILIKLQEQASGECAREKALVEEINKRRKAQQMEAGEQLQALEREWHSLCAKNAEITQACKGLEASLMALVTQCHAKGIEVPVEIKEALQ
eukprot:GCRY01002104.1.p1 GENE.GCRY01002104.1~~GCRY01002104.1.p1  ORF type:complete len:226 (+),score=47.35 GCRY01002104.1:442-1119(+)